MEGGRRDQILDSHEPWTAMNPGVKTELLTQAFALCPNTKVAEQLHCKSGLQAMSHKALSKNDYKHNMEK